MAQWLCGLACCSGSEDLSSVYTATSQPSVTQIPEHRTRSSGPISTAYITLHLPHHTPHDPVLSRGTLTVQERIDKGPSDFLLGGAENVTAVGGR